MTSAPIPCRWSVPRDNQYCPRRAAEHTFSDGTLSEPLPTASPVGSEDHEIGFPGVGMQHDHTCGVAVLLDGPDGNAVALCTLS